MFWHLKTENWNKECNGRNGSLNLERPSQGAVNHRKPFSIKMIWNKRQRKDTPGQKMNTHQLPKAKNKSNIQTKHRTHSIQPVSTKINEILPLGK